jgi:hypothetical protein
MMRFTRNRGSCVVGSLGGAAFLAFEGGGVGLMVVMKLRRIVVPQKTSRLTS